MLVNYKRVIHIEMPRAFTLAVKEFYMDVAQALMSRSISYKQFDSNIEFWRFISNEFGERANKSLEGIYNSELENSLEYTIFIEEIESNRERYGNLVLEIDGLGTQDRSDLRGMKKLNDFVNSLDSGHLMVRFCNILIDDYGIRDYDLVSLGIDN